MKKSFSTQQNPALAFITQPEQKETIPRVKTTDAPEGFKANPLFVETKSRRLQLLVQPSLYEAIKARATEEGRSVNELVHSILEDALKREGE